MAYISTTKTDAAKTFSFRVAYQKDFDLAVVAQLLVELGLKTSALADAFSQRFYQGGFAAICLREIRKDKILLTRQLKTARAAGSVIVSVSIAVSILNQISTFLASFAEDFDKRQADAVYQELSGTKDGARGAALNLLEANKDKLTGAGKTASGAWDGLTSSIGSPKFNQGWTQVGEGLAQIGKGLSKEFIQTPADFLAITILKGISGAQTRSFFLEAVGRQLNSTEENLLRNIFGLSVEYNAIRVKTGYAGFFSAGDDNGFTLKNNNRAITIGNTIYMKYTPEDFTTPRSPWLSTLVHETVHVWQHQNGGTDYMLEALHAQFTGGYGYDTDALANKKSWAMLSPEQQGSLVQHAYAFGFLQNGLPTGQWMQPKLGGGFDHRIDLEQYFKNQDIIGKLKSGQGAT